LFLMWSLFFLLLFFLIIFLIVLQCFPLKCYFIYFLYPILAIILLIAIFFIMFLFFLFFNLVPNYILSFSFCIRFGSHCFDYYLFGFFNFLWLVILLHYFFMFAFYG
jgi:hypothetical protein